MQFWRARWGAVWLLAAWSCWLDCGFAVADETGSANDLNLPAGYRQLLADRALIDQYQLRHYQVAEGQVPAAFKPVAVPGRTGPTVRVVRPRLSASTFAYRAELPDRFLPVRGFRAPILGAASNQPPAVLFWDQLSEAELKAAELINERLAHDGLLASLVRVIELLGPQRFQTNGLAAVQTLAAIGFPTDLLHAFPLAGTAASGGGLPEIITHFAGRLAGGTTLVSLIEESQRVPFRVPEGWAGFQVATESGEAAIGMLRLQFGGGYRDGIVPGDSLDVIGQMLHAFPETEFIISVPQALSRSFQMFALRSWGLSAETRVTLIEEPFPVGVWAQDNGKAGIVMGPAAGEVRRATLVPRYASRDEGSSAFLSGESFLMDGLAAAGERVIHFPLLFQGGNLLAVREPGSGERILLLSEADLHRNVALGLGPEQVLQLFRAGFGVDRCLIIPAVSYHLDFDLNVRAIDGRLVCFVNDPAPAVRTILQLGLEAMSRRGYIDAGLLENLLEDLETGPGRRVHDEIGRLLKKHRRIDGRFPAELANVFTAGPIDSAAGNFQCFLQALDLLAVPLRESLTDLSVERRDLLAALARIESARQVQRDALTRLGGRLIDIPGIPNLFRSINYLNGLHQPAGYVMPVFGGFYAPLDELAEKTMRDVAKGQWSLTSIQCAELQRNHGGVHCAAAAYPVVDSR